MGTGLIIAVISIAIVAVVTVFALRRAGILGPRKRVLATGTPGRATIVGITPTGTVINGTDYVCAIQLRVEIPGTTPYDVQTRETVPVTAMGFVVPGAVVAVRVDPADQTKVFIDWQAAPAAPTDPPGAPAGPLPPGHAIDAADIAAAVSAPSVLASVPTGSAADLLRTGVPAVGNLASFSDTQRTPRSLGQTVAPELMDDPLYVLQVDLHVPSGASRVRGTVIHRVPRAMAPLLRVGMPLRCAVDPSNPARRFAIDWDGAGAQAPATAGQTGRPA